MAVTLRLFSRMPTSAVTCTALFHVGLPHKHVVRVEAQHDEKVDPSLGQCGPWKDHPQRAGRELHHELGGRRQFDQRQAHAFGESLRRSPKLQ